MLEILVRLHVATLTLPDRARARLDGDDGQTTAEYALVLLGAAAVALLVVMWAKSGGKVGKLLDTVFDSLITMVRS